MCKLFGKNGDRSRKRRKRDFAPGSKGGNCNFRGGVWRVVKFPVCKPDASWFTPALSMLVAGLKKGIQKPRSGKLPERGKGRARDAVAAAVGCPGGRAWPGLGVRIEELAG